MAVATRIQGTERPRRHSDLVLLASVVMLSGLGLVMIYSVTRLIDQRSGALSTFSMERQLVFVVLGLIMVAVMSAIDYRELRNLAVPLYVAMILALIVVLFFPPVNGARSWISIGAIRLQPAEFAKLVTVIALAALLSSQRAPGTLKWSLVLRSGLVLALPAALILIEPDLGTTLVFPFIWLAMLFLAGASLRQIGWLVTGGIITVFAAFRLDLLGVHQKDRLAVFLDPELDPTGIGYQLLQSRRAIGAGQLVGRGLFQGTQTNLAYIPEQQNDFIFTAIAEQLGFVGGVLVLATFLVVVWRVLAISANSRDRFGALLAVGFAAMIGFHVFINVGMTINLTPVTGLPLPFISQGGSFYLAMGMAMGIANSVWLRRSAVPGDLYAG